MKSLFKYRFIGSVVALFLLISAAPGTAEEQKPTADFTVYGLSAYIWRGQELTRNSVVVQPSATVSYRGLSANLWGNLDTKPWTPTDADNPANWTETDLTLSYSRAFGPVTAGVGYIYYGLNATVKGAADPPDSQEVFVSLGLNTILSPTLTVYKEIDHYKQWYVLLGVSHSFELTKAVSLKMSASGSYLKSEYADPADPLNTGYPKYVNGSPTSDKFNNFHDGTVSVALPVSIAEHVTITPIVSYIFPLSDEARDEMKGRSKSTESSSFLVGGVGLTFAF